MLLLILLLILRISSFDTCPIYCQCYSAYDGYHVTCQNARLHEIPFNLTKFLQITNHQNLIVDLSFNFLSTLPCHFFQISTIITLILTKNHIKYFPSCFSQSSIENLFLNHNYLEFNQSTILSSTKLLHLDISSNKIFSLPRTFFFHLRRLRRLIINDENILFQLNNDQWIRSLTTHNQLTLIICNENFHLPLCLFNYLFQTKKLFSIELNFNIHCDCSLVYLPIEKIHFHYCQSNTKEKGICNQQSSRFEQGHSVIYLQNIKYHQICLKEYEICQKTNDQLTTEQFHLPLSKNFISLIKNSTKNQSITTTTTIVSVISSKKENISVGAIIFFILILFLVTIICLYVILSGYLFKTKLTKFSIRKNKQQDKSNVSVKSIERYDECQLNENLNMNSNPDQQINSYTDDEYELTFYSLQSSMTEIEITSLTSTINSSVSNETIIISNRNKEQRIY